MTDEGKNGSSRRTGMIVAAIVAVLSLVVMTTVSFDYIETGYANAVTGSALFTLFVAFCIFVFLAGREKIKRQQEVEINRLGDDNTVQYDPDGERKLHEYLTAVTSTEARIGLIQTSSPWHKDKDKSDKKEDDDS
jgi:hypothetical protein